MDSFTHITSSSNLICVVHLHLCPPIRCDCTLDLFTRNIPWVNLAKSCIRASRGARYPQLFTCWMGDYLSLRNTKETSNTSIKRYYYPPTKLREGNVFSRVCLSTDLTWQRKDLFKPLYLGNRPILPPALAQPTPDMFKLLQLEPHRTSPPRQVQTCTVWKADGWPSTERPSCFWTILNLIGWKFHKAVAGLFLFKSSRSFLRRHRYFLDKTQ